MADILELDFETHYFDPFAQITKPETEGILPIPPFDKKHLCSSYGRLPWLLAHVDKFKNEEAAVKELGEMWTTCDNISVYLDEVLDLFKTVGPNVHDCFMSADERKFFDTLPDEFQVYRGCDSARNTRGLSWTLDKELAQRFPFMMRYYARNPVVITATVLKAHVFGYKNSRNEKEIVCDPVCIERIEPIIKD